MTKKYKKIILSTLGISLGIIPIVSFVSACSKTNSLNPINPMTARIDRISSNITELKINIVIYGYNLSTDINAWEIINNDNQAVITNQFKISQQSNNQKIILEANKNIPLKLKIKIKNTNIEKTINISDTGYIDPTINPLLFNDKHLFTLNETQNASTVNEIITNTPLFKNSLNNLMYLLENYEKDWNKLDPGFNFLDPKGHADEMTKDFYKLIEDIGIYGDYKINDDLDYAKYYPQKFEKEFMRKQRILQNPSDDIKVMNSEVLDFDIDKVNDIISKNIFGYLPSNLSQLFYYLTKDEISKIFNIKEQINEVFSEINDNEGWIKLYLKTNKNKVYNVDLNSKNCNNLKTIYDFKQYIYDRSFIFSTTLWQYQVINPLFNEGFKFQQKEIQGSAWIFDRIKNPELEKQNKYEFFVGTNLHVLNYSAGFEKDGNQLNKYYRENWNGGFVSKEINAQGDGYIINDSIKSFIPNPQKKFRYETLDRTQKRSAVKFRKYNFEDDIKKLESALSKDNYIVPKHIINSSTLGSDNYIDVVWYTPNFNSEAVRVWNTSNSNYFFGDNYNQSTGMGDVFNGGIDFAITKIVLSMDEINKLFPSLAKVINTDDEKNWYVGLGNDELINSNNSVIVGGFPSNEWASTKSIGGRIRTKTRVIEKNKESPSKPQIFEQYDTQKYWKRYSEQENNEMNKYNGKSSFYVDNPRKDLEHGMSIEHVLQNSLLNIKTDNEKYLIGGASGSMAIDSRFNIIGVLYNALFADPNNIDPENPDTNSIALFKHHSKFKQWHGSIYKAVLNKMKNEGIKTIKLNP